MAIYRADIGSPAAWNGNAGGDWVGDELLGLSGLQYLLDTVTANNTIYVTGEGDSSKIKDLVCDALVGVFVRGEGVTWATGTTGTGVVSEITTNSPTVIEVLTGTLADNDELVGTTSGATDTVAGAPTQRLYALYSDINSGSAATGFIFVIGTDGTDVPDGTRFCINGNSAADVSGIYASRGYMWWENIEAKLHGNYGMYLYQAYNSVIKNGIFHNNLSYGINDYRSNALLLQTSFYGNSGYGFHGTASYVTRIYLCSFYDNTGSGIQYAVIHGSGIVCHHNTSHGIDYIGNGSTLINSVMDANLGYGINAYTGIASVFGVRFTRHTEVGDVGYDWGSKVGVMGWCRFDDNKDHLLDDTLLKSVLTDAQVDTNSYGKEDGGAGGDTNAGYVSVTANNEDYNLRSDATFRRVAVPLKVPVG